MQTVLLEREPEERFVVRLSDPREHTISSMRIRNWSRLLQAVGHDGNDQESKSFFGLSTQPRFESSTYARRKVSLPLNMSTKDTRLNTSSKDVTDHERTPIEESFYESFVLQKQSDVDTLYASNVYHSQTYLKEVRHLSIQRAYNIGHMDREIKATAEKMAELKLCKRPGISSSKYPFPRNRSAPSKRQVITPTIPRRGSFPIAPQRALDKGRSHRVRNGSPLAGRVSPRLGQDFQQRYKIRTAVSDSSLNKDNKSRSDLSSTIRQHEVPHNNSSLIGSLTKVDNEHAFSSQNLQQSTFVTELVPRNTFEHDSQKYAVASADVCDVKWIPRPLRTKPATSLPPIQFNK